jgi:hypothetical protein
MAKNAHWLFVLLLWGFAVYGTAWVYKQRRKSIRLRRFGLRTTGMITGHRFTGGDDGTFKAEVVFLTQEGKQQQTETTTTHSPQQFPQGSTVAVLYDSINPADCFVDTYVERQAPTVLLVIIWLAVIGISVLALWGVPLEKVAT